MKSSNQAVPYSVVGLSRVFKVQGSGGTWCKGCRGYMVQRVQGVHGAKGAGGSRFRGQRVQGLRGSRFRDLAGAQQQFRTTRWYKGV